MTHSHAARSERGSSGDPIVTGLPVDPLHALLMGAGFAGLAWFAAARQESSRARSAGPTARDWRRLAPYDEADRFYRRRAGRRRAALDPGNAEEASFGEAGFGEIAYPGHGGYETAAALVSGPSQGPAAASSTAARTSGEHRAPRRVRRHGMPSSFLAGVATGVLGLAIGLALQPRAFEAPFLPGAGPRIG